MRTQQFEELEQEIRALYERGDLRGAATAAIHGYGPQIYGFLLAFHKNEQATSEVFSLVMERLWIALPGFLWQCSFRTWAYAIARRESLRYRRDACRRARRYIPLTEDIACAQLEQRARAETLADLGNEDKSRFDRLREGLPVEDQELIILRADKKLAWNDLARVMHDGDEPLSNETLKRESARLRKRYQLLKDRLARRAKREGLLSDDEATAA